MGRVLRPNARFYCVNNVERVDNITGSNGAILLFDTPAGESAWSPWLSHCTSKGFEQSLSD